MKFTSRYTLKDLREIHCLSLKQVAKETGISKERIIELEKDSGFMTIDEMCQLSMVYELPIKYIFLGEQADFDRKLNEYLGGTP